MPGKNLNCLAGKTLLQHTADAVVSAGLNAPVLLSTDDDFMAEEGERLGWLVPFRRPAELSTDLAPMIGVVLHALDWYRDTNGDDPDSVMLLQPTSPLRGSACLTEATQLLRTHDAIDGVIGMQALNLPLSKLFHAGPDGVAVPVSDDDRRPVYVPNGALYLGRVKAIRKERTLYMSRILPFVFDAARSIDIDTQADWSLAAALLAAGLPPDQTDFSPVPTQEE